MVMVGMEVQVVVAKHQLYSIWILEILKILDLGLKDIITILMIVILKVIQISNWWHGTHGLPKPIPYRK